MTELDREEPSGRERDAEVEAEFADAPEAVAAPPAGWQPLLDYLRAVRGFDFQGYKTPGLMRRIERRMRTVGVEDFGAYQDYLEVHPDEFARLFDTILINVTSFFRDPLAWDGIRDQVVPQLLAARAPDEAIRVWSAGCATGEEAYTLAIVLAEALGLDAFRERVKIYATDLDEHALAHARQAAYGPRTAEQVPPALLEKYFEATEAGYVFRKDLRRQVIFGRHNLLQDAPISHIDLLACRNVLMYFNAEMQAQILPRFHFALNDGGYLFLGRAETLMAHGQLFAPIDLKRRISMKLPRRGGRDRVPVVLPEGFDGIAPGPAGGLHRMRELALESTPTATLLVDTAGRVLVANERARSLFGLAAGDVGRPLQDLRLSYRPVELRSLVDQAALERRPVMVRDVEWHVAPDDVRWLTVQVAPLVDGEGALLGTGIAFTEVTAFRRLQRDLEHANQELETAYEELQSTNEELETTNEELQSTVEELETTNEELQSTNEELETMNEELQSTNEELQTINDELRLRGEELNHTNAFLQSVLGSLSGGVAVVDRELRVIAWNRRSEELWGLRADEALGQYLLNLDIGLPAAELRQPLRVCLAGETERQELRLHAVNRRGRIIQIAIGCTPLLGAMGEIRGAIVVVEEPAAVREAGELEGA